MSTIKKVTIQNPFTSLLIHELPRHNILSKHREETRHDAIEAEFCSQSNIVLLDPSE
jgi:hypothetical protein